MASKIGGNSNQVEALFFSFNWSTEQAGLCQESISVVGCCCDTGRSLLSYGRVAWVKVSDSFNAPKHPVPMLLQWWKCVFGNLMHLFCSLFESTHQYLLTCCACAVLSSSERKQDFQQDDVYNCFSFSEPNWWVYRVNAKKKNNPKNSSDKNKNRTNKLQTI